MGRRNPALLTSVFSVGDSPSPRKAKEKGENIYHTFPNDPSGPTHKYVGNGDMCAWCGRAKEGGKLGRK